MTPEEKAVVDAALRGHRGCAPETCGGSGLDPCRLGNAIAAYLAICRCSRTERMYCQSDNCHGGADLLDEPRWVLRTWADVVTGDEVRMPGTEHTATIAMRYRHPSEDPAGTSWHVVPSTDTGPWAHTKDHFVQPGECVVLFSTEPTGQPRFMKPAAPVEIKMTTAELAALELIGHGWADRIKITS